LTGYKDPKGRLIVHKDWTRRKPPSAQIKAIFDHHDSLDYQKFGVETNLYRELLLKDIIEERRRIEKSRKGKLLKIPFYDILNTENKDKRIHRLEPKVSHGWILFNENLSAEFQNQLIDYPYIEHDDCLDALEMLWMLLNNAYKAAPVSMSAMGGL
jgi:predicted phage terminase large subunit-like protein